MPKATRKELCEQLGSHLANLQKFIVCPYTGDSSLDSWPTSNDRERLIEIAKQLGLSIGIKNVKFKHRNRLLKHIDRRYPKLGLLAFFEGLLRKLESIPVGPVMKIGQKLASGVDASRKEQLLMIRGLLTSSDWKIAVKPGTWKELEPILFELSNGQIKEARKKSKPATMGEIDFKETDKMFDEAFGLAAFLEVQRQYLLWQVRWGKKVLALAAWIYLLQNPDWDVRLRKIVLNPNITPAESKLDDKRLQERQKKQRFRQKAFVS